MAAGIRRRGRKDLDVPTAADFLTKLRDSQEKDVRDAADEVATLIRVLTPEARKALIDRAAATSLAEDRPLDERRRAIDTLATVDAREVVEKLEELLHPCQNESIRSAALLALNEQSGPEVARVLIDAWRGLTPGFQAQAVDVALGRKDRLAPVLEAIRAGKIPANDIDPPRRARLLNSADKTVAGLAKTVFGEASRKLDPKLFETFRSALDLKGDPTRGLATFKQLCIACHKVGNDGAEVGPNLASVKNRPRDQVLREILYPGMSLTPQYRQYVLATTDGRLVTGLLTSSNATSYTIRQQGGAETTVLRKDVEELNDTQVSLMPENLLEKLKPQEVADLLEFVQQVK